MESRPLIGTTPSPGPGERTLAGAPSPSSTERKLGSSRSPRIATTSRDVDRCALSVVVPVHDEIDNLDALHNRVRAALRGVVGWELVLVDDGSRDGSTERLRRIAETDRRVIVIRHETCRGQSAALATGFACTRGQAIATLDADLQNDPDDLPRMLAELEANGLDAVLGYRATRRDTWVRRSSSRLANGVRRRLTGDGVRDTGCATRVVRREALMALPRFDGMHRFIPALLHLNGFRYTEVPVAHHPRLHGTSKYGIRNRAVRAFVDALAVRWMRSRNLRVPGVEAVERSRS